MSRLPTDRAGETTLSIVMVNRPVPPAVVTVSIANVAESRVHVFLVTVVVPVTLFWIDTLEPEVQVVFVPVRRSVTRIDWCGEICDGETRKVAVVVVAVVVVAEVVAVVVAVVVAEVAAEPRRSATH